MDWGSIIGGIGVGSVATSILTQHFNARENQKERAFNKKEEAYAALLSIMTDCLVDSGKVNGSEVIHWVYRINLVGSPKVIGLANTLIDHSKPLDNKNSGESITKQLLQAMREDLGIDKRNI